MYATLYYYCTTALLILDRQAEFREKQKSKKCIHLPSCNKKKTRENNKIIKPLVLELIVRIKFIKDSTRQGEKF